MNFIESLPFNKNILYSDAYSYNEESQKIYFQKSVYKGRTQYFFKSFLQKGDIQDCQGYMYFYLDAEQKTSDFIGTYVKEEYRNTGIASFLVANWIQFCFNYGYHFLGTNKAQRKPFLIYLLKTYGFEILGENIYQNSKHVIHICQSKNDLQKYLIFENKKQEQYFMNGKIAKEDNYVAIDSITEDFRYLDSLILSRIYNLEDEYRANEKSSLVLKRNRK